MNSRSLALDEREVSNIYEDNLVDSHTRRKCDDGGDQPSNLQQYGDDDIEVEENGIDEDVEMEVPSSVTDISDTTSRETINHDIAGSMNTEHQQHNSQVIQQGPRHHQLELYNPHDSGAIMLYLQLKRRFRREHQYRDLPEDVSGRSGSEIRRGVDKELPIEQPVQLLLEDNDTGTTTKNSIVTYNQNHEDSGSDNYEPPSKRLRLYSDVALIPEVAKVACKYLALMQRQ